jgi:hypothetical protein
MKGFQDQEEISEMDASEVEKLNDLIEVPTRTAIDKSTLPVEMGRCEATVHDVEGMATLVDDQSSKSLTH